MYGKGGIDVSNNQGVWCSKCYGDHYTNDCQFPVEPLPVEAKEKNRMTYEETKQRFGLPMAEPKPTPSTPAVDECGNVLPHCDGSPAAICMLPKGHQGLHGKDDNWRVISPASDKDNDADKKDQALELFIAERQRVAIEWGIDPKGVITERMIQGIDAEVNERLRIRLVELLADPRPQPDSSSISTEQTRDRWTLVYHSSKRHPDDYIISGRQTADIIDELRAMTIDRDLWQGDHNEDCPNAAMVESTEALHREIIDKGRKVLNSTCDEGMSQTEYIEWVLDRLEGE